MGAARGFTPLLHSHRIDTPQKLKTAMTDLENALYSNIPISDEGDGSSARGSSKPKKAPSTTASGATYNKEPLRKAVGNPQKGFKDFYIFCFNLMKKALVDQL